MTFEDKSTSEISDWCCLLNLNKKDIKFQHF